MPAGFDYGTSSELGEMETPLEGTNKIYVHQDPEGRSNDPTGD